MFKVDNKSTRATSLTLLMVFLLTLNIFYLFSSVFIVVFEQVNVSWVYLLPTLEPRGFSNKTEPLVSVVLNHRYEILSIVQNYNHHPYIWNFCNLQFQNGLWSDSPTTKFLWRVCTMSAAAWVIFTAQTEAFHEGYLSKYDQIGSFLRIWSHLL